MSILSITTRHAAWVDAHNATVESERTGAAAEAQARTRLLAAGGAAPDDDADVEDEERNCRTASVWRVCKVFTQRAGREHKMARRPEQRCRDQEDHGITERFNTVGRLEIIAQESYRARPHSQSN